MENQNVLVRPADYEELARINEIRRYVNDVHVAGRPHTFRPGFCRGGFFRYGIKYHLSGS